MPATIDTRLLHPRIKDATSISQFNSSNRTSYKEVFELVGSDNSIARRLTTIDRRVSLHPTFSKLTSANAVRRYMEFHVWCVWDFMLLAKSIQNALGGFSVNWTPQEDPAALKLINSILACEETDIDQQGEVKSHLGIYIEAMRSSGADTSKIMTFLSLLKSGEDVILALDAVNAEESTKSFVSSTVCFARALPHISIAAFCFGREEVLTGVNQTILSNVPKNHPDLIGFLWYLRRHIELDGNDHGPLSKLLLKRVTDGSERKCLEAVEAGIEALEARDRYLTKIGEALTR